MMHGPEKSDPGIVAMKPANKTEQSVAEPVERRAGGQGECGPAKHVPDSEPHKRVTGAGTHTESAERFAVTHPRWEKLWGGRRRSWHLHRPYELMEIAPWPKSMISAEA